MGINTLRPDINESYLKFSVNHLGDIRFGLGAIKGVGEGAVADILRERKANGPFKSIYDFVERVNLSSCNHIWPLSRSSMARSLWRMVSGPSFL